MKKIIILLLFPLISQAQDNSKVSIRNYNDHVTGICIIASGVFINVGLSAADVNSPTANIVGISISMMGGAIALCNLKGYNEYRKINLQPTPNGVGLVYRF